MPLNSSKEIFDKFLTINGAKLVGNKSQECLYIPGTRKDRVLLVAHVDTVWNNVSNHSVIYDKKSNKVFSPAGYINNCVQNARQIDYSKFDHKDPNCLTYGLGADDRAGVAMLWLLRNSGHSILLTNGEEIGAVGARFLADDKQISDEINSHNLVIELDKMGYKEFKTYQVGSPELKNYIIDKLNYKFIDSFSYTDICFLCKKACGVNMGVGYYNEHKPLEFLDVTQWQNTLNEMREFCKNDFPCFTFDPKQNFTFNRNNDRGFVLTHYGIGNELLEGASLDVDFEEGNYRNIHDINVAQNSTEKEESKDEEK